MIIMLIVVVFILLIVATVIILKSGDKSDNFENDDCYNEDPSNDNEDYEASNSADDSYEYEELL